MSLSLSKRAFMFWKVFLLAILAGTMILVLPILAAEKPAVTIFAQGTGSYYSGEEAVFSGTNTDTNSTYLYITGPNLPESGGRLESPGKKVVSGDPQTFTVAATKPDKTWVYPWYTADLRLDAGTYTVYAVSEPKTGEQRADVPSNQTSIIIKKPYITGEISPSSLSKGQPFTVAGNAVTDGNQSSVQIWILGDTYVFNTTVPVNPDGSFAYHGERELSEKLPAGQNYLLLQDPMRDNQFDIGVSGDYVRNLKQNNGTDLFRRTGPGSLQGSNAADVLAAAFNDLDADDHTYTRDTYLILPFQVTDSGNKTIIPASATSADTGVTISADRNRAYYMGEKVVFRGQNTHSDTTYLFMTGPNLPPAGARLTSPDTPVSSQNPDSFTKVKTNPDKTWEYSYYTANLPVDPGTYNIYATSQPKNADEIGPDPAVAWIVLKKPFITANISSPLGVNATNFTVTGTAEGIPPEVQIWIFGDHYTFHTTTPVHSDGVFTFHADPALSGTLPKGQNYLVVQHPMTDSRFDIGASGDYLRNLNNGTDLFRLTGPGGLQGGRAADALAAAISDLDAGDTPYTRDTYAVIPFLTDAESQAPLS